MGVHMFQCYSQFIPPSFPHCVHKSTFPLLPCKWVHQYHLSRFHIYVLIHDTGIRQAVPSSYTSLLNICLVERSVRSFVKSPEFSETSKEIKGSSFLGSTSENTKKKKKKKELTFYIKWTILNKEMSDNEINRLTLNNPACVDCFRSILKLTQCQEKYTTIIHEGSRE